MNRLFSSLSSVFLALMRYPRSAIRLLRQVTYVDEGRVFVAEFKHTQNKSREPVSKDQDNELYRFFSAHKEGRGIWKWTHYFDVYNRHLSKFRGTASRILEIGVYSGGSLEMWSSYFGDRASLIGVDIEPACRAYASDRVRILIGDQGDMSRWEEWTNDIRGVDAVIDDGSHRATDQITTFKALFPLLAPGGVFICEDIHGIESGFAAFLYPIVNSLNYLNLVDGSPLTSIANELQADIRGVYFYPFMVVIEKRHESIEHLMAPKHGTTWQPFYEGAAFNTEPQNEQ